MNPLHYHNKKSEVEKKYRNKDGKNALIALAAGFTIGAASFIYGVSHSAISPKENPQVAQYVETNSQYNNLINLRNDIKNFPKKDYPESIQSNLESALNQENQIESLDQSIEQMSTILKEKEQQSEVKAYLTSISDEYKQKRTMGVVGSVASVYLATVGFFISMIVNKRKKDRDIETLRETLKGVAT